MSYFLENRLKLLIILLVFIFCTYTTQTFILGGENEIEQQAAKIKKNFTYDTEYSEGETVEEVGEMGDIWGAFGGLYEFLTFQGFQDSGMPSVLLGFFLFVMAIVILVTTFIVLSIVYDFIKALPFT